MFAMIGLLLLTAQTRPLPPPASVPEAHQELNTKLDTKVHDYNLSAANFVEALTHVVGEFEIPMGIEWVDTPTAKARLNLSWKNATLEEVIRSITESQPGYQMEIKSGLVHIHPSKLIRDRQNFLKIKIKAFQSHDELDDVVSSKLRDLVKLTVSPPRPQRGRGGIGSSGAATLDVPRINLRLQGVTVEDVLDALVTASAKRIWIVTFSDDPKLTTTGYRRTLSLWNSSPIPDNEQPVWDLFHWGDPIPRALFVKN